MANFDKMTDDGRKLFLGYPQERMIRKYGLPSDETYLYFWMLCRVYRITREEGFVEEYRMPVSPEAWAGMRAQGSTPAWPGCGEATGGDAWRRASNGVAMTLYDVLCYAKDDAAATGEFINLNSLVTLISAAGNPGGGMMSKYTKLLDEHPDELAQVLAAMGGVPQGKADVSYEMPVFDFMNVRFQLWHADDEFPAMTEIFVDKGILSYMHYETVWYLMMHYMMTIDRGLREKLSPEPDGGRAGEDENFYSWS
ncbi:MAG: DUF3786 domain-containing protein [Lachnospiraceae bacterium]|nr:DUF3786 domain-containing protein [Lachnospiraceae bacterium]